jgi:hypothetical protein
VNKADFGQMYLLSGVKNGTSDTSTVLISRSSQEILFFRPKGNSWEQYFKLENGGFIFADTSQRGFQVTTEKFVYQYKFDDQLQPKLELALFNYMNCTHIMMLKRANACITYKYGSVGFSVIRRKFGHTFLAPISTESFQKTITLPLNRSRKYIVCKGNRLRLYDQSDYRLRYEIKLPFKQRMKLHGNEDYQTQMSILSIKTCQDEKTVVILVGEDRYWDNKKSTYFLYVINAKGKRWNLAFERNLPRTLRNVCPSFMFSIGDNYDIIMVDRRRIIRYNYAEE